mmetsp:Transcript_1830/g.2056  ORF Transcript_1830/g.2056 Transcript_1830/m.2056 type:complete len:361 (+) Transcript_1830:97-1179(+)
MKEKYPHPRLPKVAIIGASYSGLTLGNILHEHSIPFEMFESSSPPPHQSQSSNNQTIQTMYVIGPFILPSYRYVMTQLGLCYSNNIRNHSTKNTTSSIDDDCCYERHNVIVTLSQNIRHIIQYNTTIVSIQNQNQKQHIRQYRKGYQKEEELIASSSNCLYCTSESNRNENHKTNNKSTTRKIHGPFEYIIAADGVHSIIGNQSTTISQNIYLIGDARWVNDKWYDLGYTRNSKGGDIALNDGLELGHILKNIILRQKNHGDDDDDDKVQLSQAECIGIENLVSLQKFSAFAKYKVRQKQKVLFRFLKTLLFAFLIQKFLHGTNTFACPTLTSLVMSYKVNGDTKVSNKDESILIPPFLI